MRRVVVTGMGIVSSIGNNTQKCWHRFGKASPESSKRTTMQNLGSAARFMARPI